MSTPIDCLSCVRHVANNGARKRWHFAFAILRAVRSFQSLIETNSRLLPRLPHRPSSSSFIAIKIIPGLNDRQDLQEAIDKDSLRDVVKSKDLLRLAQLGGVQRLASALVGTNPSDGVDGDPQFLSRRRRTFGSNTYPATFPKDFFFFLWQSFKENILLILLACAILCRVIGGVEEDDLNQGWADGCPVFVALVFVIIAGAIGNLRLSRQLEELIHDSCHMKIDVVRSGQRNSVHIFDIVVGDVVFLNIGDRIPADGLLLNGRFLQVDESSINGEGNRVDVSQAQNPFLVSGCRLASGSGRMLVTNVGMKGNKYWEAILTSIKASYKGQTPLQARLDKMTLFIGKVGLVLAVVALIVLSFRHYLFGAQENGKRRVPTAENKFRQVMDKIALVLAGVVSIVVNENANQGQGHHGRRTKFRQVMNAAASVMTASITIVVVTIPEGWPFAFTWALGWSLRKMRDDQVLVQTASACETMGLVTTICSDEKCLQTMKVTQFWLGEEALEKDAFSRIPNDTLQLLHQGIGMNCSTVIPNSFPELTEKAICFWAFSETGMDTEKLRENYRVESHESSRSHNKRHGVLVQNNNDQSRHVHWKGDAGVILSMCSSYLDGDGIPKDLDGGAKVKLEERIQGPEAHKLIAFAHREISADETGVDLQLPKHGFTFLGMVSCDMDIKDSIEDFRDAEISLKLVTDVCAADAKAIAIECGLLSGCDDFDQVIMDGKDFRNYSMEERMEKIGNICVIAGASPQDRLLVVQCLKKKGEIVAAVTGHGSDHARALEEADVGVWMGILGTEEARKSSDVIILDGKFSSVIKAVGWGRCFYRNIQKFIQFQLTINVAAAVFSFTSALFWDSVPISEAKLLSLHLIFSILGTIALATDHPTQCLMKRKPLGRSEPLVTNYMWRNLITQAVYQISMLLFLDFRGRTIFHANAKVKNAVVFNAFILLQVFNVFNARRLEKKNIFKGIHQNRLLLGSVGMALTLQVLMLEFSRKVTEAEGLALWHWGACVGIAATSWPLGWLTKLIPV